MAYKDKNKQREATREAMRRYREAEKRRKEREQGITQNDVIPNDVIPSVIPNFGQPNCECRHCQQNRTNGNKHVINHGPHKTAEQLASNEVNRFSLPSDVDYDGTDKRNMYNEV